MIRKLERERQAGYDFREAWLQFKDLTDDEAKALFCALNMSERSYSPWQTLFPEARARLLRDGRLTRVVEDLPSGQTVDLQLRTTGKLVAETTVVVGTGQGSFQEIPLHSSQFAPNPKPAQHSGTAFPSLGH